MKDFIVQVFSLSSRNSFSLRPVTVGSHVLNFRS